MKLKVKKWKVEVEYEQGEDYYAKKVKKHIIKRYIKEALDECTIGASMWGKFKNLKIRRTR